MSNSGDRLFSFRKIINVFNLLFFLISNGNKVMADTLYVSLPELHGNYNVNMTRMAEFNIGTQLDSIINVSIHWSGTLTPGLGHGDGVERPSDQWFDWHTQISAIMDPDESGFWYAFSGPFNGVFEDTALFKNFLNPSWHFLLDGHGEVTAGLEPIIVIGGVMSSPPSGMIHSAELIIDAIISTNKVSENNYSTSKLSSGILYQNYPNPFNTYSIIKFELFELENVSLKIFDTLGQEVKSVINGYSSAGAYQIEFNSKNLTTGIYYYRLYIGNTIQTKKMLLLR